jgi:hypothetical protein
MTSSQRRLSRRVPVAVFAVLVTVIGAVCSCATVGIDSKRSSAWNGSRVIKNPRTVRLGVIVSDKAGSALQQEIASLLPLVFLEKRFVFPRDTREAEFVVDVFAAEHDYKEGFELKKSITMEVLLWPNYTNPLAASGDNGEGDGDSNNGDDNDDNGDGDEEWMPVRDVQYRDILALFADKGGGERAFRSETPLAAARTVATGSLGYVSAKNTEALLRKTVRRVTGIASRIKRERVREICGR